MNISNSVENYNKKFGAVFTPNAWARRIVEKHFFTQWLNGASILDPTAGEGVFIESFLSLAREKGHSLTQDRLAQLYGVELNQKFIDNFHHRIKSKYSIDFPEDNFRQGDILFQNVEIKADFLVGNPPWVNFTDLDETYKEKIKHLFIEFGLVTNQKDLLLGNARTDIASLILIKVLLSNLKENGKAVFFLPLSIFQNDGANQAFRKYKVRGVNFCVEDIMDFNGNKVFDDILGRYGVARFQRDKPQMFPIHYHVLENGKWLLHKAKPLFNSTDPLTVFNDDASELRLQGFQKIVLAKHLQPRQGVNTCGANDIFFFSSFQAVGSHQVELKSKKGERFVVSAKYVFPLTVSATLTKGEPRPEKVILIPHKTDGKPLDLPSLEAEEGLLDNRKGVLINTWIQKGYWWSLMGIGPYSFVPYKIMWKAFGDSKFTPRILHPDDFLGSWQGNQSLNAFIGASTFDEAQEIYNKLTNPLIQEYLSSLRMQGTCNWAQPGRMKKLMEFV
jgi:hypothetical protein